MKVISYDDWQKRFITDVEIDEPEQCSFFDNGAVKDNSTGDFIVKCDQVTEASQ